MISGKSGASLEKLPVEGVSLNLGAWIWIGWIRKDWIWILSHPLVSNRAAQGSWGCGRRRKAAGGEPSGGSLPEFTKTGAPGSNSTGSSNHGDVRGTSNTPRALSWRFREGRAVRCCRGGPTAVAPCWRRCPSYRGELQATGFFLKGKGPRGKAHWGCSWPKMLRGEAGGEVRAGRRGGD